MRQPVTTPGKFFLPSLVFVLLTAPAAAGAPEFPDPRSLPSLEIHWRWGATWIEDLVVDGDTVYVFGLRFAAALDAETGTALWTTRFAERTSPSPDSRPFLTGGRIAAVYGIEVHLIDRESGVVDGVFRADSNRVEITGPPLVAKLLRLQSGAELVRVDEATALPLARRSFAGHVFAWAAHRGALVVTHTRQDEAGKYHTELLGLAADDLTTRWRVALEDDGHFQTIGDALYFDVLLDRTRRHFALDPETGELDAPLPVLPPPGEYIPATWEFAVTHTSAPGDPTGRLRRHDPATGEPQWTRTLPAPYRFHVVSDERLFVYCQPRSGGRGFLAELDATSGEIRQLAYALRRVQRLVVHGRSLIAATAEGVVAFSTDEFAPPESATHPVDEEIRRLLARLARRRLPDHDVTAELVALGDEAVPLLGALAAEGKLGPLEIYAVAPVLGGAGYRPAAPVLGRLLESAAAKQPVTDGKHRFPSPRMPILRALARLGGAAEVDAVGRVLVDPDVDLGERRQALFTLTAIGAPASLDWIDRAFERPAEPSPWWGPPDPRKWLELLSDPPTAEELDESHHEDTAVPPPPIPPEGAGRLHRHHQVRLVEEGGRRFLLFPHRLLSWSDLWAAELTADGTPGPAVPLGISLDRLAGARSTDAGIEADLEAGVLSVRVVDGARRSAAVVMADALRDGDGDGLTDLSEEMLGLDPARADSDGDGLRDSEDLTPNARPAGRRDEEEEIALAIAEVYFTFLEPEEGAGLAMAESSTGLDWRGRSGPTLNVDAETFARQRGLVYPSAVVTFAITPADLEAEYPPPVDPGPGERVYVMDVSGGKSYTAVVGKIGSRWVVKSLDLWMIS